MIRAELACAYKSRNAFLAERFEDKGDFWWRIGFVEDKEEELGCLSLKDCRGIGDEGYCVWRGVIYLVERELARFYRRLEMNDELFCRVSCGAQGSETFRASRSHAPWYLRCCCAQFEGRIKSLMLRDANWRLKYIVDVASLRLACQAIRPVLNTVIYLQESLYNIMAVSRGDYPLK